MQPQALFLNKCPTSAADVEEWSCGPFKCGRTINSQATKKNGRNAGAKDEWEGLWLDSKTLGTKS